VFHVLLVENADLVAVNPAAQRDARPIPALRLAEFQRRPVPRAAPVAPSGAVPVSAPRPPQVAGGPWLPLPQLTEPLDVAVGPSGEFYVADRVTQQVQKFDARGDLQATIRAAGDKSLQDPRSVAVAPNGDLYVLDSEPTRVHVFDATGRFTHTIVLPGGYFPSGINIDPAGGLLVADTGQSRALRLMNDGRIAVFGKSGTEKTVLDQPTDVAVAPSGEIFVVDGARSRVVVFGPDLAFRREWQIPTMPTFPGQHLLLAGARVLVSQPEQGVVLSYDAEGKLEGEYGRDRFKQPVGMALTQDGQMLVTDIGVHGLFKIPLDGAAAAGGAAAK
jgi:sugar lactone lactonase YvrE